MDFPRYVGHLRALNSRDKGCRFPGCSFKRYVDGHHVRHWSQGGETRLSNLITLCRFHHRLVHEGRVMVRVLDDGAFRFIRPDARSFDSPAPPSADWNDLVAVHRQAQIRITAQTAIGRWTGERLNVGLVVENLMQKAARAKNVSAGTSLPQPGVSSPPPPTPAPP